MLRLSVTLLSSSPTGAIYGLDFFLGDALRSQLLNGAKSSHFILFKWVSTFYVGCHINWDYRHLVNLAFYNGQVKTWKNRNVDLNLCRNFHCYVTIGQNVVASVSKAIRQWRKVSLGSFGEWINSIYIFVFTFFSDLFMHSHMYMCTWRQHGHMGS